MNLIYKIKNTLNAIYFKFVEDSKIEVKTIKHKSLSFIFYPLCFIN